MQRKVFMKSAALAGHGEHFDFLESKNCCRRMILETGEETGVDELEVVGVAMERLQARNIPPIVRWDRLTILLWRRLRKRVGSS